MTDTQHIPISNVFYLDKGKSKGILADKNLLQFYSVDQGESEGVIADESLTQESESEIINKIIITNKEKYEIDETEHEEPLVTDNPVINGQIYFNLFQYGKDLLNSLDVTCEQAYMVTLR